MIIASTSAQENSNVYRLEKEEVTDNIFTMVRPDWLRDFVVGNITVILSTEGLIVFDSGNSSYVAKQVIDAIKKETDLPVKYLILSHGHIDHTGGTHTFKSEWPEMEIIGHTSVFNYIKRDQKRLQDRAKSTKDKHERSDSLIAAFRGEGHHPKVVEYYSRYLIRDAPFIAEQYRTTTISLPTITIQDSINLVLGDQVFSVFKVGNGKTPSDLMLYAHQDKVLITGDVVTRPIPYGFSNTAKEWVDVLKFLTSLDVKYIIPGHGSSFKDLNILERQMQLFQLVIQHVESGVNSGKDASEIRSSISLGPEREFFTQNDPVAEYRFDTWFLNPFITRTYKSLTKSAD